MVGRALCLFLCLLLPAISTCFKQALLQQRTLHPAIKSCGLRFEKRGPCHAPACSSVPTSATAAASARSASASAIQAGMASTAPIAPLILTTVSQASHRAVRLLLRRSLAWQGGA